VRIALAMADLNYVDARMADIENAYLTATVTEKVWTVLGPEFGDTGNSLLIVWALYGLKSAGAALHKHLAECMKNLGRKPCCADRDILGAKLKKTVFSNGSIAWGMNSGKYVQCAIQNIMEYTTAPPGRKK
jgi:hypothetical protein